MAEVAALLSRRRGNINAAAAGMSDTPAGKAAWWCENDAVSETWHLFSTELNDLEYSRPRQYKPGMSIEARGCGSCWLHSCSGAAAAAGVDLAKTAADGGNSQGELALFAAAVAGHTDVVRLLLDAGVSPTTLSAI